MAYFYFDFRDTDKQNLHDLVPSLLTQLLTNSCAPHDLPVCVVAPKPSPYAAVVPASEGPVPRALRARSCADSEEQRAYEYELVLTASEPAPGRPPPTTPPTSDRGGHAASAQIWRFAEVGLGPSVNADNFTW